MPAKKKAKNKKKKKDKKEKGAPVALDLPEKRKKKKKKKEAVVMTEAITIDTTDEDYTYEQVLVPRRCSRRASNVTFALLAVAVACLPAVARR